MVIEKFINGMTVSWIVNRVNIKMNFYKGTTSTFLVWISWAMCFFVVRTINQNNEVRLLLTYFIYNGTVVIVENEAAVSK